ncbi:sigma-70 family RNA polymerase sigma factor [Acinetobacter qingfengensis]|uniref:Sigma-70 family RNA polymerase sigma factor n=1 Tax=Acinetobacter qingfengensis TaxID=1262585 RepID=A0A1E7RDG8_9GAMM|nr:sigma-70 family RNA polymerase sigma factor [Acinetobacter qingfengensis]OEY97267.1 hypothetical protein BJI46_02280 [Acinetobacter qingfengensis]
MNATLNFHQSQFIAALYQENYTWLYAWLIKKLKQQEYAEDILQDTFYRIIKLPPSTIIHHPRSYLAQTATRIIIDQARRKQVEQAYLDYLSAQDAQYNLETPENILLAVELLDRIATMLDGMDEKIRQIFLLRYLEDLNQLEIAEQLQLSRRQVQLALIKAIQHCDYILQTA